MVIAFGHATMVEVIRRPVKMSQIEYIRTSVFGNNTAGHERSRNPRFVDGIELHERELYLKLG